MKIGIFEFELQTAELGAVKVKNLSPQAISEITKRLPEYTKLSGHDVLLACIPSLCTTADKTNITGSEFTEEELTELAERYLEKSPSLYDREAGENTVDFLGRIFCLEMTSYNDTMAKIVDRSRCINSAYSEVSRLSDMMKDNSAVASIKGFHSATDNLRAVLKDVEAVEALRALQSPAKGILDGIQDTQSLLNSGVLWKDELIQNSISPRQQLWEAPDRLPKFSPETFRIPENPIHKTNEKLTDLTERMDAFNSTMVGHIEATAVALQAVAKEINTGSKGTSSQNWVAITIATLSLIVTLGSCARDSFKSAPISKPQSAAVATSAEKTIPLQEKPGVPKK